jgi:hypothetical protein
MTFVLAERIDDAIEAALLPANDDCDAVDPELKEIISSQIDSVPATASAFNQV